MLQGVFVVQLFKFVGTNLREMIHFDVQLIGGMAIHNGMIAEMATGEGKH